MLTEAHAVLPASDLKRAQDFYHNALDSTRMPKRDDNLIYRLDAGSTFEIYETSNAGTAAEHPDVFPHRRVRQRHGAAARTWRHVRGLRLPRSEDRERGGRLGASKAAWFKDTEGNFICLTELG